MCVWCVCAPVFLVFGFDNMFCANVRCSVKRVREKECEIPFMTRLRVRSSLGTTFHQMVALSTKDQIQD